MGIFFCAQMEASREITGCVRVRRFDVDRCQFLPKDKHRADGKLELITTSSRGEAPAESVLDLKIEARFLSVCYLFRHDLDLP